MARDSKVYERWESCLQGVGGNQESYLEEEVLKQRRGKLSQKLDKGIPRAEESAGREGLGEALRCLE